MFVCGSYVCMWPSRKEEEAKKKGEEKKNVVMSLANLTNVSVLRYLNFVNLDQNKLQI